MARILHVIASVNPAGGGPIEGIRQIAGSLKPHGHEIHVASCDPPDADYLGGFPFKVHALGPGRGKYAYSPKLIPWLLENGSRFDGVIANGIWQFSSFATRSAMRRLGKPYVVFTHGMLDPWFKKTYPLKHMKKAVYWPWGEYRVLRDAAAVLFTCEEERVLARQSFRLYQAKERVVNYGTSGPTGDPEALCATYYGSYPDLQGKRMLLYLSRIHPKKGCDLLIRAFAKVASDQPDLRLVMAGPDQVGLAAELQKLASSLGVSDKISWPGMLTGDLKWGAYYASEAFVLTSHQENFGIVVAEALACGRPALISNKVNIWREVEASNGGLVADDTEAGALDLLSRWLNLDESKRLGMGTSAKACFVDNFEISGAAASLLAVLGIPDEEPTQ